MRKILIVGAGKSSTFLIRYLADLAPGNRWKLVVADGNLRSIREKTSRFRQVTPAEVDIRDDEARRALIEDADIVISLMPPELHILIARDCLLFKKDLITSSYLSPEMRALHEDAANAGLMFMGEMGLDPGIDHMMAARIITGIKRIAGILTSYKSYCGGMIAPEFDDNPWHYKIHWNPRSIVLAGQQGARFLHKGKEEFQSYKEVFESAKRITLPNLGRFSYYMNRDSMPYIELYDIPEVKTFFRATLRHPKFCTSWQILVELGLTDPNDSFDGRGKTYEDWVKAKSGYIEKPGSSFTQFLSAKLGFVNADRLLRLLRWLGLLSIDSMPEVKTSSSEFLLDLLRVKLAMKPEDRDWVVQAHEAIYIHKGKKIALSSVLSVTGDSKSSAISKTVGLPMGLLARMILSQRIKKPLGVHIPIMPQVYKPILREMEKEGLVFKEEFL